MGGPQRCLVVGDPHAVGTLARKLRESDTDAEVAAVLPVPAGGLPDDLTTAVRAAVRRDRIDRVIVAPRSTDAAEMLEVIRVAKLEGVRVTVLPRLFEVVGSSVEFDQIDGLTMLGVRRFGLSRSSRAVKRIFDLVGSTILLAAAAPVMAVIAIAIRLDTPGPMLFRQLRVGRDGRYFLMLKFRSMVADADRRKAELLHLNETEGLFKITEDPRITRVGRWLRRSSLDELPQLFNVWRGEMSLVGPRPLVLDEDAQVQGLDRARLQLTPGMTGPWQVLGSTRVPMREMVVIDYLYAANWSLWSDMKIILRTIPHMLSGRGR
jgi:exopolysaccharide biosynthesis polyprenyl glycosylphosphotransferase